MSQLLNGNGIISIDGNGIVNTDGIDITTTTSSTFVLQQNIKEVKDVKFIENEEGNFIEIIYYLTSNFYIGTSPSQSMVKERYGVVNGKLQLIKTIKGVETPGYYVAPTIQWEE